MAAGLVAGSTALLSDSLDNLGDALTYGLSLYAVSRGPRSKAKVALWLTRSGWPDLAVELVPAILFLRSALRVLRNAISELRRAPGAPAKGEFVTLRHR